MFLDDENSDLIAYSLYLHGSDNRPERERMKRILTRAIKHELTQRQRDCVTMYYLEGMKMKEIADAMNLSKSTVTRHIQSATRKLRKVASYYEK
ncbi:MAG: sigma-70 family RNA polymerase sigma factor [Ruminococcus sp.]|nr:sigma-70 family RNA polymerase sigma factor [Ruminococcus sp.]